jgi:hypothetical protein
MSRSDLRRALVAALTAGSLLAVAPAAAQAAAGDLTYDGCFNGDGTLGCVDLPFSPLQQPVDTAVSPDGKSVAARRGANRITLPHRWPATGTYRVRVIATDASGNRSTPKSAQFRAK